jgi:sulfate adenylyltransferase subunit 1
MDLQDYSKKAFEKIKTDFQQFAAQAFPGKDIRFIPISALKGDNVVEPSKKMDWYKGKTLLHILETIPVRKDHDLVHGRFPVQYIIRPESEKFHDYRGYAGRIAGGVFRKGDKVRVLPSGISSTITSIDSFNGAIKEAFPPMSVILTLDDDIDISRGNMIVQEQDLPMENTEIRVMLCWMNPKPLQLNNKYILKHTTNDIRCFVKDVKFILDINNMEKIKKDKIVKMNEIAYVELRTIKPIFFDPYSVNRITGSLILIDESTNETLGAGMIV